MDDYGALIDDLAAEQVSTQSLLVDIGPDDWFRATPAKGWDVRDTIAHLADTDEIAIDTCLAGPRPLNDFATRLASPEDLTLWGVLRGRKQTGVEVLAWWERTSTTERDVLARLDPGMRVPWGLGMRPNSFVTARLMEAWAHGLDVRTALGAVVDDTDRLRHVAWLGYRALPYAFSLAGRESVTGDQLRVELTLPSGASYTLGPTDAPNRVRGPAGEFCRLFVHRLAVSQATGLEAEGEGAVAALEVARAFL
jgi:uncharacterized protein (TIGR03084 family)